MTARYGADIDRRVAIIGMAARFPGASTLDRYWANLRDGVCSVRHFEASELAEPSLLGQPDFVAASGTLEEIDRFDAELFGISEREAALTEPQQRLFLECCHEALEHAGHGDPDPARRVGVFAGAGMHLYSLQTYLLRNLDGLADIHDPVTALQVVIGNQPDFAATRVAYRLGLTGPAVSVQTGCSTALVAVHLACQALLQDDADLVLAGAAAVHVPQATGYHYREGSILSPAGHCRAFDAGADGTVGGNGVAAVVLKPLRRALEDGDTVHAVILASAVNNDGAGKLSFTAPSVEGQAAVVELALERAGVAADSIGYVEAHGTGTKLGDPIEFEALTQAFRTRTDRAGFCTLGAVKPNVGHMDSAAGMAGLLKVVLMLQRGQIPPLVHFEAPNPALRLEGSPFTIATELRDWPRGETPRRAGVSALGVGGTNAHLLLEEAPAAVPARAAMPAPGLMPLSARDPAALAELAARHRDHLARHPDLRLADVMTTAALGRRAFAHRLVALGDSPEALARSLDASLTHASGGFARGEARPEGLAPLAFAFAGQGIPLRGRAAALYERFAAVRDVLDRCESVARADGGGGLLALLLDADPDDESPVDTSLAQPALFACQVALARLWEELGVAPDLVIGHSVGEYAAASVAGALSLDDGVRLTALRGRLMQERTAPGAMVAVRADGEAVERLLAGSTGAELAVVNGSLSHVLAGPEAAVADLLSRLEAEGVPARRLAVTRAFHTSLLDPVLPELRRHLESVPLRPLVLPLAGGADGLLLPAGTELDAEHFIRQARQTDRFDRAMAALAGAGCAGVLEVGPEAVLGGILGQGLADVPVIGPWRGAAGAVEAFLAALSELHCLGTPVEWPALLAGCGGRRVPLPTYPFQGRSHWIEPAAKPEPARAATDAAVPVRALVAEQLDVMAELSDLLERQVALLGDG